MDNRLLAPGALAGTLTMPATAMPLARSSTDAEISVENVSDYAAFLDLAPEWSRLVEETGVDHPFLAHEWFRSWWDSFGAGNKLHVLVVRKSAKAIGIVPLMMNSVRIYGLKVRRLQSIHNDHSPRFDFIAGDASEAVDRAVWSYLSGRRHLWDVLQLSQLPTASPTLDHLRKLAHAGGFPTGVWPSDRSPYVDLTQGWDAYLARLSSQHKKKIRQHVRRLEDLGRVELEIVSADEKIAAALEDGFRLEAAGWKSQSGTAIRCRPELVDFYGRLARAAAASGALRLFFLTVAGTRIAFAYGLAHKKKLFVLKAGYDPEYAAHSPYNVLCYLVFRDACERGLTEYEFLGVDDGWKLRWTKTVKPHFWIYIFGNTPRARLLHWLKFRVAPKIKQGLYHPPG